MDLSLRTFLLTLGLLTASLSLGCGGDDGSDGDGSPDGNPPPGQVTQTQLAHVKSGLVVPSTARDTGEEVLYVGAQAVFEASIQGSGGQTLVTTGTLTQNGQSFVYSATPADRLRIVWSNGPATELYVTAFNGDFSGDADRFVSRDHVVRLRAVQEGTADLSLESQRANGQRASTLEGTFKLDGVTYTAQLSEAGTFSSQVDVSFVQHESDTVLTGTITGDDGYSQQVEETFRFKLVNSVTNDDRTLRSAWTVGGKQYAIQDGRIRFEQRNGRVVLSDYWIIQGTVLEDGVQIGQVGYELTDVYLSIFVDVRGERIELYRFTA